MPGNAKNRKQQQTEGITLFLVLLSPQSFIRSDAKLEDYKDTSFRRQ